MNSFYETKADRDDYLLIYEYESSEINTHFHKSLEFVYCLEGKTEVFINGESFILESDEMYAVPSYSVHYNKKIGENRILSFVFAHNYFHDFEKSFPDKMFPYVLKNREKNREFIEPLRDFRFNYLKKNNYFYERIPFLKRQAFINEFLYQLSEIYPLCPVLQPKFNNTILEILTFINEHHTENITLNMLSQKYGYSSQYFSELFNKHVGCNLNTYINNVRVENVIAEYNHPKNEKPLTMIAFDNGFNSLATFYRALGKNPSKNILKKSPPL